MTGDDVRDVRGRAHEHAAETVADQVHTAALVFGEALGFGADAFREHVVASAPQPRSATPVR